MEKQWYEGTYAGFLLICTSMTGVQDPAGI